MTSLFGFPTLKELYEKEIFARRITFRKIVETKEFRLIIYCNYSAILFVKIFHIFLDELNLTRFFIKINPKGCHHYRIDSITERGTRNGWNDYSIYSFQFFEQIHFFMVCNNVIPSGFWKYYASFSIKISSLRDYADPNVHPCSTRNPLKDNILPLSGIRV